MQFLCGNRKHTAYNLSHKYRSKKCQYYCKCYKWLSRILNNQSNKVTPLNNNVASSIKNSKLGKHLAKTGLSNNNLASLAAIGLVLSGALILRRRKNKIVKLEYKEAKSFYNKIFKYFLLSLKNSPKF